MRALFFGVLAGCAVQAPPTDDCDSARRIFAHCGVTLPLLQTATCSGFTRSVAQCVERTHGDCDALAALSGQLESCAAELDNQLPPVGDVPLPGGDGGVDLATADLASADLSTSEDLASPTDLATTDLAGGWVGYVFSESVEAGAQHQHQTPVLAPGHYEFSITGTGNADLYVRIGTAPTLALFACAPRLPDSNESCTVALPSSARIYAVVRASTETSSYTLVGRQVP